MRGPGKALLLLAVLAVALFFLNPTMDDFQNYIRNATTKQSGTILGALAGAAAGIGAYTRADYLVASTYTAGRGDKSDVYLGFAKGVFVRVKKAR